MTLMSTYNIKESFRKYTLAAFMLFAMVICIMTGACVRQSSVDRAMDSAESLLEERPDSSLAILRGIGTDDLQGSATKGRYALLLSMALDKCYIDTTDFSVLQPALDYYPLNGTPDERLRTYYYQGCSQRVGWCYNYGKQAIGRQYG